MGDIKLQQVINICGNYTSKSSNNYFFQCPICKDSHKDNLVYNSSKEIIKCFKDESHTLKVLNLINKNKKNNDFSINYEPLKDNNYSIKVNEPPIWERRQEKYIEYMVLAQNILLNNDELLNYLNKKRGWAKKTIDLAGIGFDDTENEFIIPIVSLKYDCITDFERRYYSKIPAEKQVKRVGGGKETIAKIWGLSKAKTLYITEGMIDGITLTQWLLDKKQKDFTIYSCSNGVRSLFKCLTEINFNNFEEIKLILDNDPAGNEVTKKVLEKYPFIKDSRQFLINANLNDITEYYVEKVR